MIEKLLLDINGIYVGPRRGYFSDRLVSDFGVSREESKLFVRELLAPAIVGKADVKEGLPKLLNKWGINKTVDEMLELWWAEEKELNEPLINTVDTIRSNGIPTFLVSHQEKYRARYLMDELGLAKHVDGAFFSCDVGFMKTEVEFWEIVMDQFKGVKPGQLLFWDDAQQNVDSAAKMGLVARLYSNFESFQQETNALIGR